MKLRDLPTFFQYVGAEKCVKLKSGYIFVYICLCSTSYIVNKECNAAILFSKLFLTAIT